MSDAHCNHLDIISSADGDCTVSPGTNVEPVECANAAAADATTSPAGASTPRGDATTARANSADSQPGPAGPTRPWVGILFECCAAYSRVYRDPDVPYYSGRCPQCGRQVTLRVGPDGVTSRLFRAVPT